MKLEQLKIGEKYIIEALAAHNVDNRSILFELPNGSYISVSVQNIECVRAANEQPEEPYSIFDSEKMGSWIITKDGFTYAYYPYRCAESENIVHDKDEARAAAERERDRLNAKWKKDELCTRLESQLEDSMKMLMKLREQNPSENLEDAERSLDDAVTFLHSYQDEKYNQAPNN